ncbi:MAG: hypothetical protein EP318_05140 [Rhodobacteraceae bacterium]|nr:MAG: hypothetical protein EP318_05140 [Paracoccaceae bacterium]
MRVKILLCAATLALAACSSLIDGTRRENRVYFDDVYFRGAAKAVDKADRRNFVSTARPVSRSPAGAREAVVYHATKYCIRWFGISEIAWETDPKAEGLPVVNDTIEVRGTCVE